MVNHQPFQIVTQFPKPPALVRHALNQLQILRSGDADAISALGDLDDLARPWEPAGCSAKLRNQIWLWCDEVASWVNREYAWRTVQLIPECWPKHPHIANELPVLACLRLMASDSLGPDLLEEWHRHALPLFVERFAARLGESACRTGKHVDWPAVGRYEAAYSHDAVAGRRELYYLDTHPPRQLRPAAGTAAAASGQSFLNVTADAVTHTHTRSQPSTDHP
jgi:hypothetical protein